MWNISFTILYHLVLLAGAHLYWDNNKNGVYYLALIDNQSHRVQLLVWLCFFSDISNYFQISYKYNKTECNYMIVSVLI